MAPPKRSWRLWASRRSRWSRNASMSDGQSRRISTFKDTFSLMASSPISSSASHPRRHIVQRTIILQAVMPLYRHAVKPLNRASTFIFARNTSARPRGRQAPRPSIARPALESMLLGGSVEVAPGRAEDYGDTRIIHVLVTLSLSVSGLKAALGKQPRRRTRHVGARIRVQIWRRPSDYAGAVSLQLQLFMICSQNGRRADEDARSVRRAAVVQPPAQGEVVQVNL